MFPIAEPRYKQWWRIDGNTDIVVLPKINRYVSRVVHPGPNVMFEHNLPLSAVQCRNQTRSHLGTVHHSLRCAHVKNVFQHVAIGEVFRMAQDSQQCTEHGLYVAMPLTARDGYIVHPVVRLLLLPNDTVEVTMSDPYALEDVFLGYLGPSYETLGVALELVKFELHRRWDTTSTTSLRCANCTFTLHSSRLNEVWSLTTTRLCSKCYSDKLEADINEYALASAIS